jgi:DNA-binding transcriptional ArsR family regulator
MAKKNTKPIPQIAKLLDAISPPARLEILQSLGLEEACVCHLEAELGIRQAAISQHLMALREAGLIKSRRDGRFMYYSLLDPALLDLIRLAARIAGVAAEIPASTQNATIEKCRCPNCAAVAAG